MLQTFLVFGAGAALGFLLAWLTYRDLLLEKFNTGFDAGWEAREAATYAVAARERGESLPPADRIEPLHGEQE